MVYRAARVGDPHDCPKHSRSIDIKGPGAQTILIEGKPAALVGDIVDCRLARDGTLTTGHVHVAFQGKQPATFGSSTSHGGVVTGAATTVVLGYRFEGDKGDRVMQRLQLIGAARARALLLPEDDPQRKRILATVDRLAQDNKAVEYARLTEHIYRDNNYPIGHPRHGENQDPPEGWDQLEVWDTGITGFHAAVYRSSYDGSTVLVFRGTDIWQGRQEWHGKFEFADIIANLAQGAGYVGPQYDQAVAYATFIQAKYGNVIVVGDSLGGGLASVAGTATGLPTYTFNASGIHPNTAIRYGLLPPLANVQAYYVNGEILSSLQDNPLLPLPDPIGRRTRLDPAPGDRSQTPDYLHCPPAVIAALEARKDGDVNTLLGFLQ